MGIPIFFIGGDKKPAQWRANLCVVVFSPADPNGSALQSLDPHSGGFADLVKQSLPILRAFVIQPTYRHRLVLLNAWRSDQGLQSAACRLVGGWWFRGGKRWALHATLLVVTVYMHSIDARTYWQAAFREKMHLCINDLKLAIPLRNKKPAKGGLCFLCGGYHSSISGTIHSGDWPSLDIRTIPASS